MIIGLSGWARSGKDTVADHLVKKHGFVKMAFADPMRQALYLLNPRIQVAELNNVSLAAAVDGLGWELLKEESPDIRPLMQRLGTEVGRQLFGETFWVDLAMRQVEQHENVVISDCRFQNEADAIIAAGGMVVRVNRPGLEPANDHISERALDDFTFDEVIENSGSVTELQKYVTSRAKLWESIF